jgi:hypothetical protein
VRHRGFIDYAPAELGEIKNQSAMDFQIRASLRKKLSLGEGRMRKHAGWDFAISFE